MSTPTPVTASVFAKDLGERALTAFLFAVIPFGFLALKATSWSDAKTIGLSALAAGGAAVLSIAKGLLAQRLTGTASLSRVVGEASTVVPPVQPDADPVVPNDGPVGRHAYQGPQPGPTPDPASQGDGTVV